MKTKPLIPVQAGISHDERIRALHSIQPAGAAAPAPYDSEFRRPWWLFSGHLETLYANSRAAALHVDYEPLEAQTPDSDVVLFHCVRGEPGRPLLVIFHGLEGSSSSPSVRLLAHHFVGRGWSVVVPHFRTCGMMNRLPRAYHAGDADDVEWMVKYACVLMGAPQAHAAGISLGGNALAKWLGRSGQSYLSSAACICAPLDLGLCSQRIGGWLNSRLYGRHFLETLVAKLRAKERQYPFLLEGKRARRIRSVRDFDDVYTAPIHGFSNVADYYARASAKDDLAGVRIPLLCINPLNDPLVPPESVPKLESLPACVRVEQPRHGGHLGFATGRRRLDWLPSRLEAFFAAR